MDNLMREYIAEKHDDNISQPIRSEYERIFFAMKEINKPLKELTRQDFITVLTSAFFVTSETDMMSKHKRFLSYLSWLQEHDYVTAEQIEEYKSITAKDLSRVELYKASYFLDVNEFYEVVRKICTLRAYNTDLTIPVALYLSYAGIDLQDICDIRKEDIIEEECNVYIRSAKVYVGMNALFVSEILKYLKADNYVKTVWGKEITLYYKESPYLMRTDKKEHLTLNSLRASLKRFNLFSNDIGKYLKFEKVFWAGKFHRYFKYEQAGGQLTNEYIRESFYYYITDRHLRVVKNNYKQFKNYYELR